MIFLLSKVLWIETIAYLIEQKNMKNISLEKLIQWFKSEKYLT